ncbi:GrpB family protein [Paenibacillus herberti]|uniref:GrpB family protein n=1 Tax=Paenibacillus herberti TaxID=1619309 RepID=A0A229NU23_9BACL|nr:GrpB family protein [Paenibacillus herberti]OXM13362.1 hypothetical protein CGZ75_20070 [Paenibacillus herberti]
MEKVYFQNAPSVYEKAHQLYLTESARIRALLPEADLQHIGSTAVTGSWTKGDLDIQVRVTKDQFDNAASMLFRMYDINEGSDSTDSFRSFKDDEMNPPLGVQLTVIGSEVDFFYKIRDVMRINDSYRQQYDDLKQRFQGGDMEAYRAEKNEFFAWLMETPEYSKLDAKRDTGA